MSTVTRGNRIRAYPNGAQRRLLERWFGASRWLWNTALEIRSEAYRVCGLQLTGDDLSRWLTQWKRTPGHEWLAAVPATCLTQCLRNQDVAFRNFFARRARYPKFKRKSAAASLRFQDTGRAWARGVVSLPKLGSLKLAEALPKVERPDLVTLSRDAAGHYYVSFCAEVETSWLRITHRAVGVDLGLTHLATLSTGEKIPNPKRYHARLKYLRQQQRCLARRQKGSRRREQQRLRVARAHARVRQERQYALHALTTRLVREFDLIFYRRPEREGDGTRAARPRDPRCRVQRGAPPAHLQVQLVRQDPGDGRSLVCLEQEVLEMPVHPRWVAAR